MHGSKLTVWPKLACWILTSFVLSSLWLSSSPQQVYGSAGRPGNQSGSQARFATDLRLGSAPVQMIRRSDVRLQLAVGTVTHSGNMRSEPRINPQTVKGLIFLGDKVTFLDERNVDTNLWYYVRITQRVNPRGVPVGTEGWVHATLLSRPLQPTPTPQPAARPLPTQSALPLLNGAQAASSTTEGETNWPVIVLVIVLVLLVLGVFIKVITNRGSVGKKSREWIFEYLIEKVFDFIGGFFGGDS